MFMTSYIPGLVVSLGKSLLTYMIKLFFISLGVVEIICPKLHIYLCQNRKSNIMKKEFCRGPVDGFGPNGPYSLNQKMVDLLFLMEMSNHNLKLLTNWASIGPCTQELVI